MAMRRHIMTARRKAALRKAQLASARKRMKRRVKAKGRKIVRKARKNSPTIAKNTGKAVAYAAGARFMQRQLGTPMTAAYFGGTLLAKAAKGAYVQSSKKKKGKKK